jgi:3-isopropylmalate/(R)-2-methylmalate dehydratase small subunit
MTIKGRAYLFGDHVNTDIIIAGRYCHLPTVEEMAAHIMEDFDGDFAGAFIKGSIIVAGKNFGCGSSREEAPAALKAAGVSCVIAENFARIFFRNCINIGLPIFECPEAAKAIKDGAVVSASVEDGRISVEGLDETFQSDSFPEFMNDLIKRGGLIADAKLRLKEQQGK